MVIEEKGFIKLRTLAIVGLILTKPKKQNNRQFDYELRIFMKCFNICEKCEIVYWSNLAPKLNEWWMNGKFTTLLIG